MELTVAQKKSQELLQTIITKSWEDESFKQELIANPIETIEKATGERISLPEGKTLIVKDQTDYSVVYVNIPAEPNMENLELSEEQLEEVAGGAKIMTNPLWVIPTLPTDSSKDGFQQ